MKIEIERILKREKQIIPKIDGIYSCINDKFLTDNNLKFQKMYDWMSHGYDIAEKVIGKIRYGNSIKELRSEIMSELEWKAESKILYVSIGTGRDLFFIPQSIDLRKIHITGADISIGMLKKCQKNLKTRLDMDFFHCCAEDLPFEDNSFDIVFHVGGINFFSDKGRAIQEMIRVAKPGTKLLISDETNEHINEQYKKSNLSKKYFNNEKFDLNDIINSLPKNVEGLEVKKLWGNRFYTITFRKGN